MELLQLCDVVRDDTLPELGVRLEDHEGDGAVNLNILSCRTERRRKYTSITQSLIIIKTLLRIIYQKSYCVIILQMPNSQPNNIVATLI